MDMIWQAGDAAYRIYFHRWASRKVPIRHTVLPTCRAQDGRASWRGHGFSFEQRAGDVVRRRHVPAAQVRVRGVRTVVSVRERVPAADARGGCARAIAVLGVRAGGGRAEAAVEARAARARGVRVWRGVRGRGGPHATRRGSSRRRRGARARGAAPAARGAPRARQQWRTGNARRGRACPRMAGRGGGPRRGRIRAHGVHRRGRVAAVDGLAICGAGVHSRARGDAAESTAVARQRSGDVGDRGHQADGQVNAHGSRRRECAARAGGPLRARAGCDGHSATQVRGRRGAGQGSS